MLSDNELFQVERPAFRLHQLNVFNWGPFGGLHRCEIDPEGTAIIGITGSGKTTLIDAFVTLLTEKPKYNLASTGGHESDRDLVSYIRGVVGSGNDSGDGAHISRKGKTTTGICATYTNGDQTVHLAGLFWIDGNSFSNSDLKRAWIFSRNPDATLEEWLAILDEGGLRRLKQVLNDSGETARLFDTSSGGKRAYLAKVRSFFEVSDNAFNLLNRAAGLKQLNSIDIIFRELVLDDHSQFDRAAEVASDFDRLTEIHEELLTAQRQIRSLHPVKKLYNTHLKCRADLELQEQLKRLLPIWIAENGYRLWDQQVEHCRVTLAEKSDSLRTLLDQQKAIEADKDTCHQKYLQTGGSNIEDLEARIAGQEKDIKRLNRNVEDYRQLCANLQIEPQEQARTFGQQKSSLDQLQHSVEVEESQAEERANELGAALAKYQAEHSQIGAELEASEKQTHSNLPSDFTRFRAALAEAIQLDHRDLPFVAELIEVKETESEWRGAIERAIGGNRFRILVPADQIKPALRWVNQQHQHRLHIRLLEASATPQAAQFLDDGYTRKLNFKPHPLREALKALLASHDLHCVDSPDTLAQTPHALTREGLLSGKRGYFEKKDQKRLDQDWFTGFDNRDRLQMLQAQLKAAAARRDDAQAAFDKANGQRKAVSEKRQLITQLKNLPFEDIDVQQAHEALKQLEARLKQLLDPNSDAAKAHADYKAAKERFEAITEKVDSAKDTKTRAKIDLENSEKKRAIYEQQRGDGLTVNESTLARQHLPLPETVTAESIGAFERQTNTNLENRRAELQNAKTEIEVNLAKAMKDAQSCDNGVLAEVGSEIADAPAYLQRLETLKNEDLPKKREKFLNYLNQSSDQGVAQLLSSISESVDRIRERIESLNHSLHRVDFKDDRYLKLMVQDVSHESLRTLERARKQLRAAQLQTGEDSPEQHYKALQHVIQLVREAAEKKHTVGARALLDPRYRVEFHAVEVERSTGATKDKFKGSQGGSGGEKEIIASYILTASLCYALSPEGSDYPIHSTIVLDEAFSKSSRVVASRIIQALREFNLHPIFVTPNKEMRLLRAHTHSVIYIHRKEFRATMTSISWEELETRIETQKSARQPVEPSSS